MRSPFDRPQSVSRHTVYLAKLVAVCIGLPAFTVSQALAGPPASETEPERIDQLQNQAFSTSLSEWLLLKPQDEETRFLYARILTWDQDWEKSLVQYETLLASSPDNVDYLLGKAQVLVWSRQATAAVPILERARELAPDYVAVRRLHQRALTIVDERESQSLSALDVERSAANVRENALAGATSSFVPQARVMAAASMDFLDNGFADWSSLFVGGDYRFSPRKVIYGEVRSTDRFNQQDTDLTLGGHFPLSSQWSAFVQGSVGPDADILPEWSAMAGVRRSLPMNWGIEATYRHSEYALTYGSVMGLGVERYWRAYRFSYSLQRGKAEGAQATFSHVIRADFYYGDRDYIGFIVANGEEAESVGLGRLLVSDIETYGLTGQHWLTESWALTWAADYHQQGKVYTRQGIYVGVKHKF